MTTVDTTRTDVALGTLAATAEQTGCPPEPVRRMCDLADFTRGMDTTAITAIAGAGSMAVDAAAQIAPLVTEAAGALDGIGGGVPSQGLCDAGDALASHTGLCQDAVNSVGSCAGAMDQLTVGCAGEISALVEEVCGLASTALACGAGDAAAGMVEGAVTAVSEMLGQRNSGLEALVDITVGDCLPAADDMLLTGAAGAAGLALGVGAAVAVGGAVELAAEFTADTSVEPSGCPEQTPEPACPEPRPEPQPEPECVEPAAEPEPAPEPAPESSVDPVHGFDKADRVPDAPGSPATVADQPVSPAAVGETPETGVPAAPPEASSATDAATDGWNPDIWTTGTGDPTGTAPESADAW
ncbi:hypothetical protein ACTXKQ_00650 [Corynebacterium variabile]|uniref:Uncharacterized protein n=1 Tax=Corynebacterium variabile (strain DSM 44702 / CIP 107183 / JCM 12073 / NCIMB 30131) TaxID=858619 RepID=G0HGN5_CORVD|nr:hypothetical protein [Corynebacterium variabile]AEK37642.1 hypothetical protein CVAR_2297 [Corynebacterium variabile DSM 44702]